MPEPAVPSDDELSADNGDNVLGGFIKDLSFAGWDCRDQLGEARHLLEVQGVTVTDVLVTEQKEPEPWWRF